MKEPHCYTSTIISSVLNQSELLPAYVSVVQRLHGESFAITKDDFRTLLADPKEIVAFVLVGNQLVATAQASLLWTPPDLQAYINNVVTHADFGGRGFGSLVMQTLEQAIKTQWGKNGDRAVKLLLSNSPEKNNGGFYDQLGWTNRGPASPHPTVMWIKTI